MYERLRSYLCTCTSLLILPINNQDLYFFSLESMQIVILFLIVFQLI